MRGWCHPRNNVKVFQGVQSNQVWFLRDDVPGDGAVESLAVGAGWVGPIKEANGDRASGGRGSVDAEGRHDLVKIETVLASRLVEGNWIQYFSTTGEGANGFVADHEIGLPWNITCYQECIAGKTLDDDLTTCGDLEESATGLSVGRVDRIGTARNVETVTRGSVGIDVEWRGWGCGDVGIHIGSAEDVDAWRANVGVDGGSAIDTYGQRGVGNGDRDTRCWRCGGDRVEARVAATVPVPRRTAAVPRIRSPRDNDRIFFTFIKSPCTQID
jgi:hypothetical protein